MDAKRRDSGAEEPVSSGPQRRRLTIGVIAALIVAFVTARQLRSSDDEPVVLPTPAVTGEITRGPVILPGEIVPHALSITIPVEPPEAATEMQVTTDPTWRSAEWVPAADEARLGISSYGYQIIYTRFRTPDGITATTPIGREIFGPDTDELGIPRPRIGVGGPTTVVVEIHNGRHVRGAQGSSDVVVGQLPQTVPPADGWQVSTGDDALDIVSVRHVTRPRGSGFTESGDIVTATVHWVHLELAAPLAPGTTYRVTTPDDYLADDYRQLTLDFDDRATWTPNIHVNQAGYAPLDPKKVAELTEPFRTVQPIDPAWSPGFALIDTDGTVVLEGTAQPRRPGPNGELDRGDLTGTSVWELDFSDLTQPGLFRVCVDTVGCSETIRVADDVWGTVANAVARAMYHQRSGIALGPPYTSIERPETYTPEAGVVVKATEYSRLDGLQADPETVFDGVIEGATDTVIDNAVGGHYDAGDWDRRIDHLGYVRAAIATYEVNPGLWQASDLNLPESGDAIPDILDEALWTLDFFGRLQDDDGAVSGGIEAVSHPVTGTVSWTEELDVYRFAPDPYSSYAYAGAAAEMATAIADLDPVRSAALVESAERAMAWADLQPPGAYADAVFAKRATAAVALYRQTGESRYHDIFLESSPFSAGPLDFLECHNPQAWCDAAWIYLRIEDHPVSTTERENALQSFRNSADAVIAAANTTTFGWTIEDPRIPLIWGLGPGGAPKTTTLLRAYLVTGDQRYLETAQQSAAFSLGMNPTNQVFLTGIGRRGVTDPLIVDINEGALPVWPGTPVYGLHQLGSGDYGWAEQYFIGPAGSTPNGYESPFTWSYFDIHNIPFTSEFTVHQSHAPALFAFGTLAGLATLPE